MEISTSRITTIITLFIAGVTTACADDLVGLYLGGSVGEAHVRSLDDLSSYSTYAPSLRFDESHLGFKLFAGMRPITFLGVEVEYADFGRAGTSPPPCFPSPAHCPRWLLRGRRRQAKRRFRVCDGLRTASHSIFGVLRKSRGCAVAHPGTSEHSAHYRMPRQFQLRPFQG